MSAVAESRARIQAPSVYCKAATAASYIAVASTLTAATAAAASAAAVAAPAA